jgi:hypothetical protein
MFQKISALAQKIERLVNNAAYVFELIQWGLTALRDIAGILNRFPKPANYDQKENDSVSQPNTGGSEGSEKQQSGQSSPNV